MSKKIWVVVGLTVVVGSLAFASLAFAQTPTPATPGQGYGRGMMAGGTGGGYGRMMTQGQGYTGTVGGGMMGGYGRGRGGMMGGNFDAGASGPLHTYMLDAFAKALDITRANLDQQLAAGQTMLDIATAKGLTPAQFFAAMQTARADALAQAVAVGALTQAQADQMQSHMIGRGVGNCPNLTAAPTN